MEQQLEIRDDAECYQHIVAIVSLYLGSPSRRDGAEEREEVVLVQRQEVNMQVSDHYTYNPLASFLLVTNSITNHLRAQAVKRFIKEDLKMEVDVWNVALYGGLRQYDPDRYTSNSILDKYHGKTVLFFSNAFNFFGRDSRSTIELCSSHALAAAVSNGTTCLFLDSSAFSSYEELVQGTVFCSRETLSKVSDNLLESRKFSDIDDLLTEVQQRKQYETLDFIKFSLPVQTKKFSLGSQNPEAEAKKIAKHLKRRLPSDRCLVSIGNGKSDGSPAINLHGGKSPCVIDRDMTSSTDQIIVSFGLPYHTSVTVLEPMPASPQGAQNQLFPDSGRMRSNLDPLEGYMLINCLPIRKRCDLLWQAARRTGDNEASRIWSPFALDALALSMISTVNHEVSTFLHEAPWPDTILPSDPSKLPQENIRPLMAAHFPAIFALLNCPDALHPSVRLSPTILRVLCYAMASARPQRKLHIAGKALVPLYQRRQRAFSLIKLAISRFLITKSWTADQLTNFFASVSSIHSMRNAALRDTSKVIVKQIADLTKRSVHAVLRGKKDANDVVRGTTWVSAMEWDRRIEVAEEREKKIGEDEMEARKVLGRMITDSGDASGDASGDVSGRAQAGNRVRRAVFELGADIGRSL